MFIDVRTLGFCLTGAIRAYVESRIKSALGPSARRVVKVTARLDDVNAGRGGVDKRCSLVVALRRRGSAVAQAMHEDLYAAVDEASRRVRQSVRRLARRRIARERKDRQRPGALMAM